MSDPMTKHEAQLAKSQLRCAQLAAENTRLRDLLENLCKAADNYVGMMNEDGDTDVDLARAFLDASAALDGRQ